MLLTSLTKPKATRVLGIDASTGSIAFCLFENGVPVKYGKFPLEGMDIYEKVADAGKKTRIASEFLKPDYVAIESAIMVKSADAGLKIAMIVGAALSVLLKPGVKTVSIAPIQWQAFIGNKNPTKADKLALEKEIPGKSVTWYKGEMRNRRKQKTMDFFNTTFGTDIEDNDVGDACGIAYYAYKNMTER